MTKRYAIIAADMVTSLGVGTDAVWNAMMRGECGIRPMRRFEHGKYRTNVAAELTPEAESEIGLPPDARAFGMARFVGRSVLDQAGAGLDGIGLILSTTKAEIASLEHRVLTGADDGDRKDIPSEMAAALCAEFPEVASSLAISNACASGAVAIAQACRMTARGHVPAMLVIGVDALTDFIVAGFSSLASLSERPCKPFDAERDGLSLGEGAAAVLVTPLDAAPCEPVGVVEGWGVANDANHITGPSRTGEGLQLALRQALDMAGWQPWDVQYANAHGTATVYNDEMETQALHGVFGDTPPPATSMKGYFGHTMGAAGVVEAVLTLKALEQGRVPASLGMGELGVTVPLDVPAEARAIPSFTRAVSMKSGFGGVNGVLALSKGAAS